MTDKKPMGKRVATKQSGNKRDIPSRPEEDRRARQAGRLANVIRTQERLMERGKWNVRSLAAELECSEKTIRRYLEVMEIAEGPV
jgi:hypothetical protein